MVGGFADLSDLGEVAGVSLSVWTSTFRYTYSIMENGIILHAWPDGEPLMEQEQVLLEVLGQMKSETLEVIQEGRKRE